MNLKNKKLHAGQWGQRQKTRLDSDGQGRAARVEKRSPAGKCLALKDGNGKGRHAVWQPHCLRLQQRTITSCLVKQSAIGFRLMRREQTAQQMGSVIATFNFTRAAVVMAIASYMGVMVCPAG